MSNPFKLMLYMFYDALLCMFYDACIPCVSALQEQSTVQHRDRAVHACRAENTQTQHGTP